MVLQLDEVSNMFEIVVTEKYTMKVAVYLPLLFEGTDFVRIHIPPFHIEHKNYFLHIFNNTQPIFFKDKDGDICLKPYSCIIHSSELDY